jgi:hypothetical protein
MNRKLGFVLSMALGITTLNVAAAAQTPLQAPANPRLDYAIYDPSPGAGLLRQVDWDDHHRCDGDHDRDDRHCRWQNHDRYRDQYYYRGNSYYGAAPVYVQHGWYDRHGKWHWDKRYRRDDSR